MEIFKERWHKLNIIGYRNGHFHSEEEKDEEAKHIVNVNPDFLIVGMGILMQEQFLLKVKDTGFQGIGFTCGGFIHQTAKNEIDYYPAWVDRMNLRFLYRMYREPHIRKRYCKQHSSSLHDLFGKDFSDSMIKPYDRRSYCQYGNERDEY